MQMHLEHEPEKKSGHRLPSVPQLERFRAKASPAPDAKRSTRKTGPAVRRIVTEGPVIVQMIETFSPLLQPVTFAPDM